MNKLLKISAAIGIFIVSLSTGYYFGIFLPMKEDFINQQLERTSKNESVGKHYLADKIDYCEQWATKKAKEECLAKYNCSQDGYAISDVDKYFKSCLIEENVISCNN